MDVSIIIVSYNTLQLTRNCLQSIFDKTKDIEFEVIVSDNGSSDGSIEMIRNEFPNVILVENNANLGFGKANNIGYRYANGRYILLLNSDTVLLNNAVKLFVDIIQQLPNNIACLGCRLTGKDGGYVHSYGNYPTLWNELKRKPLHFLTTIKLLDDEFDSAPTTPIGNGCLIVEYITGADLFIKKSVIDSFGLFDNKFFMYYEDTELQYRYKQNGFFSCLYDSPQIMHIEKGSSHISSIGKELNGLMLCYETIHGKWSKRLFKALFFILSIPGMLIDCRFPIKERLSYLKRITQG